MKFANRLKEEKIQEWEQEYMEYKLLKKQLKSMDEHGTASGFYRLLEEQLVKVVSFMRVQQERISEELEDDLLPIAQQNSAPGSGGSWTADGGSVPRGTSSPPRSRSQTLLRCQMLEANIDQFRDYVRLNQDGLRKIVKKFDKRFHTSFKEVYPVAATELPFSVREVQAWMLDPTMQLLKLMRQRHPSADRPLRQFNFWVEELKVGCQLARVRRFSFHLPLTPLRLQLCDADQEDLRLVIKNTFIAGIGEDEDPIEGERKRVLGRPRTYSDRAVDALVSDDDTLVDALASDNDADEPARHGATSRAAAPPSEPGFSAASAEAPKVEDDSSGASASTHEHWVVTPVIFPEYAACNALGPTTPPRDTGCAAFRAEVLGRVSLDDVDADREAAWSPVAARSRARGSAGRSTTSSHESRWGATGAGSPCSRQTPGAGNHGSTDSDHANCSGIGGAGAGSEPTARPPGAAAAAPAAGTVRTWSSGQGGVGASSSSRSGRWWTDVSDTCALTGFPVRMLPYPPFKLRAGASEASEGSVRLVDGQYLVLQVLSNWQFEALGRTLDMSDINSLDKHIQQCKLGPWRLGKALQLFAEGSSKHGELESMRARARRKLETLRHIQRSRLAQEGDDRLPRRAPARAPEPVATLAAKGRQQRFRHHACRAAAPGLAAGGSV